MKAPDKAPAKKAVAKKAPAKKAPAKKVANRPKVVAPTELKEQLPKQELPPPVSVETHGLSEEDDKLRVLFYGPPGVGKTTAALRAADYGKIIVIDADKGLKARALKRAGIKTDNVEVYNGEISYDALEALHAQIRERMDGGEEIFAIVWDTVTLTMPWLIEASVAEGVAKAAKLSRKRASTEVYVEDYGTMTQQLKQLITRRFMDLDCHLILTAHEKRDKDDNGAVRISPDITPALSNAISGSMDLVIAVRSEMDEDGNQTWDAITKPVERYEAKDRLGMLPSILQDPGFSTVLELVEAE